MNEEEAIEWAKELLQDKEKYVKYHSWVGTNTFISIQKLLNLIDKQQKEIEEYKELVECIEEFKRLKRPVMEIVHEMNKFEDEFISKDIIRDKIKELEEQKKHQEKVGLKYSEAGLFQGKINALNELLKEE